jgi:hypothetical protein
VQGTWKGAASRLEAEEADDPVYVDEQDRALLH